MKVWELEKLLDQVDHNLPVKLLTYYNEELPSYITGIIVDDVEIVLTDEEL